MVGRRKQIREQMVRSRDPLVRMQLGALLDSSQRRRGGILRKIEDAVDSLLGPTVSQWPPGVLGVLFLLVLTIVIFVIVVILECTTIPR